MKKATIILATIALGAISIFGQKHHKRFSTTNVLHYDFTISVNDTTNIIEGKAILFAKQKEATKKLELNLVNKQQTTGMQVSKVLRNNVVVPFEHTSNLLLIPFTEMKTGSVDTFAIYYSGVPADGLIISDNKFGNRTFFGDNWPNRGRNWLPVVDHPSDKATVAFTINAPQHYQVIATGRFLGTTNHPNKTATTKYATKIPLPVKVMVMAAAPFVIDSVATYNKVPVTSWVFPQNKEAGFTDYREAMLPLQYFSQLIAPYPYEKLAHVQSKTRFGGMENAGNIFYYENSVTGQKQLLSLLTHELAHQWFGNSVSEANWHHIWLSEGFATYLTDMFLEQHYGRNGMVRNLTSERRKVIQHSKRSLKPVIDTTVTNYLSLLNPNSYQKGAWTLHMLRREIGDSLFLLSLKEFYKQYQFSNAFTADYVNIVQQLYGKDMNWFFNQWLYGVGQPKLSVTWKQKGKKTTVAVEQEQKQAAFNFLLDLDIVLPNGTTQRQTVRISKKKQNFVFKTGQMPTQIIPDPDCCLLFE